MERAFIAIHVPLSPALRELVAALSRVGGPVKPVRAEMLHFTLRFLGGVDEQLLPLFAEAIRESVAGVAPFDVALRGIGAFPNERRPSVVWVGAQPSPLSAIVSQLSSLIEIAGIAPEPRPWSPHLTVARVKSKPPGAMFDLFTSHRDADFGLVRVERVDLMLSELRREGAQHTLHASVAL